MTEPKELSIDEMASMLSDAPAPEVPAATVEDKQAEPPASPEPVQQEEKPVVAQDDKSQPPSGDGTKKTQETQPKEDKPSGKFQPKEAEVPEGVQKRINKAVYEKHEAERQAEAAKREAADLRSKLEEKSQAPGKPAGDKTPDKPAFQFSETEPVAPVEDDFETLSDYFKAQQSHIKELAAWQYRKDRAEDMATRQVEFQRVQSAQRQAEAQRIEREQSQKWIGRMTTFAETNPVIQEAANGKVGEFLTAAGQADFIKQSDVGPEILVYLHEHGDEAMKIAQSGDPILVAAALGRLESKLISSSGKADPKPNPKPRESSDLPEPVKVVGGKSSPNRGIDLSDDKTSIEDFGREFRRQIEAAS